jgi:hypothetical protein
VGTSGEHVGKTRRKGDPFLAGQLGVKDSEHQQHAKRRGRQDIDADQSALLAPRLLSIRSHRSRPALGRDILPSPTTGGFGLPTRHSHTDADDDSISYLRKQMLNESLDELDHCNSLVSAVLRD